MVVNHSHRMQSKIFRFLLFHCCPPTYCGALYKCLRQVTCIHYLTVVLLPYVHTCNSPLMHPCQGLLLSIPLKRRKKRKKKTLSLPTHPIPRRHTIRRRQLRRIPPHRLSPIPTNGTLPTPRTAIQRPFLRLRRIRRRSLLHGDGHVVFGTVFVHEIFFNFENKLRRRISDICVWGDAGVIAWGERVGLAGGPAGWCGGCCPFF